MSMINASSALRTLEKGKMSKKGSELSSIEYHVLQTHYPESLYLLQLKKKPLNAWTAEIKRRVAMGIQKYK